MSWQTHNNSNGITCRIQESQHGYDFFNWPHDVTVLGTSMSSTQHFDFIFNLAQIVLQGFHRNRERGTLTAVRASPE
jgi:hypothetical protein